MEVVVLVLEGSEVKKGEIALVISPLRVQEWRKARTLRGGVFIIISWPAGVQSYSKKKKKHLE